MYDFAFVYLEYLWDTLAAPVSLLPSQRWVTLLPFQTSKRTGLRRSPALKIAACRDEKYVTPHWVWRGCSIRARSRVVAQMFNRQSRVSPRSRTIRIPMLCLLMSFSRSFLNLDKGFYTGIVLYVHSSVKIRYIPPPAVLSRREPSSGYRPVQVSLSQRQ
jgi:hypothetical protein